MRKLIACLACRNQGTRLYGKPLQNLDIEQRFSVLEYIVSAIKTFEPVSDIVLGISEGVENLGYQTLASKLGVQFIVGDEKDVLQRLIQCCKVADGTDVFRVTTESPFACFEAVEGAWKQHLEEENDLTTLDHVPVGSGFEITRLSAYERAWVNGENKHRSELCSLYIREHKHEFKIGYVPLPDEIKRSDIRLTIDYPEDLVLCRAVYQRFKHLAPRIPIAEIIHFLDGRPDLKILVEPFIPASLKMMYL